MIFSITNKQVWYGKSDISLFDQTLIFVIKDINALKDINNLTCRMKCVVADVLWVSALITKGLHRVDRKLVDGELIVDKFFRFLKSDRSTNIRREEIKTCSLQIHRKKSRCRTLKKLNYKYFL